MLKSKVFQIFIPVGSIAAILLAGNSMAQVIADTTLPNNSVTVDGCTVCDIDGGTTMEDNLFHSFEQFSIPTGGEAYFQNAPSIANIFSRVTSNSISDINGTIRANGSANLFLINPNGIILGEGAVLDIGGSFVGTTAQSVDFIDDGSRFSAVDTQTGTSLSVNVPLGLQFGQATPGTIINRSRASPNGEVNALGAVFGLGSLAPVGLQVSPGRTLALVGGEVRLEGGNLTSPGGRVEISSLGSNSFVNLVSDSIGWFLEYDNAESFSDIHLSDFALVDSSLIGGNSGPISLNGKSVSLQGLSQIFALNFGTQSGAPINLSATDSVVLRDIDLTTRLNSSIFSLTFGAANAADIKTEATDLSLAEGATIGSGTFAGGNTGNVSISTRNLLEVSGGLLPSGIFAQVLGGAEGNGGELNVQTRQLRVRDGSQISTTTFGLGNAGRLNVFASDSISLVGSTTFVDDPQRIQPSSIQSLVERGSTGNSGSMNLVTGQLAVTDGAQVSNRVLNGGQGADLQVTATESILLNGTAPNATFLEGSSGIFVAADPAYRSPTGDLVFTAGNSGDLTVNTQRLTVQNGARISADTFGSGSGGELTLNLDQLLVQAGGQIRAGSLVEEGATTLERGPGGNLTVNASELIDVSGTGNIGATPVPSALITNAEGTGSAGNIFINETLGNNLSLIVRDGAEISASTESSTGGDISINNLDILLLRTGGDMTAEAGRAQGAGDGGNIVLSMPDGFVITVPNEDSDITANAFEGDGGRIVITSQGVYGFVVRDSSFIDSAENNGINDITASSRFGSSGTVSINNLTTDPTQSLLALPATPIDAAPIARRCLADSEGQNAFVVTGRGGIAPNPEAVVRNEISTPVGFASDTAGAIAPSTPDQTVDSSMNNASEPLVEAQGWQRDTNGNIVLLASAAPGNSSRFTQTEAACPS